MSFNASMYSAVGTKTSESDLFGRARKTAQSNKSRTGFARGLKEGVDRSLSQLPTTVLGRQSERLYRRAIAAMDD